MEEVTIGELTRNLERLTEQIGDYIHSNEERMRMVETAVAELRISNKNFVWFVGAIITIISIASNITLKFI